MIIEETSFVTSTFDGSVPCVVQTWHGFASSEEFRAATIKVLEFVRAQRARYPRIQFLVDARQLGSLLKPDMDWAASVADPQLFAAGMRKIAFIVPETAIGRTSIRSYQAAAHHVAKSPLESRQFADLAEARAWLAA